MESKSNNQEGLSRAERRQLKKERKEAKRQEIARKSRQQKLIQRTIGSIILLFWQWEVGTVSINGG